MKKILMVVLVLMMIAIASVANAETRFMDGKVMAVDMIDLTMKIITEDGNIWEVDQDDDWNLYDNVIVIFDTMNTPQVEDDEIVWVIYLEAE